MDANEKKARAKNAFLDHIHEVPDQVPVPTVKHWTGAGLEPIPHDDYTVCYDSDAKHTLRRVGNADHTLANLRRRLRIEVDLDHRVVHISLDPSFA